MTTTKPKVKVKRPKGRPARDYPTIDAPFESVVKALVQPVKEKTDTKAR